MTNEISEDQLTRQYELEQRMLALGQDQYTKVINAARETNSEGGTNYGTSLMVNAIDDVAANIEGFIKGAKAGKAGRRHVALKYLEQVDAKLLALLGLRMVIDGISTRRLVQNTAILLADRVEDQVRFSHFEEEAKPLFNKVRNQVKKNTSYRHKRTVMNVAAGRAGIDFSEWPKNDKLHLGMKIIEVIISVTGYCEITSVAVRKNRTNLYLVPTEKVMDWIKQKNSRCELMTPTHLPCIIPPRDWTSPFEGGYHTNAIMRMNLIKTRNGGYLEELGNRVNEMPVVYETVNALQRTAWKINAPVVETMRTIWDNHLSVAGVPSRDRVWAVPCPKCGESIKLNGAAKAKREPHACFEADEVAHKAWKKKASFQYHANLSMGSKLVSFDRTLWVAEEFLKEDAIYMVYQLDFRGRIYAVPHLNPQGDDPMKGLLTFAKGKAIEDGTAAGWLAIQGANVYGYDKANLEDRISFIEGMNDRILAAAADPLADLWWTEADKPWQFLAFIYEWAGFLTEGYGYVSHLPIAMDASASGIQHFSAMLRDTEGGTAVNLLPSEVPHDIYRKVMDVVDQKFSADLCSEATVDYAKAIMSLNPDRSATKRQVMVLPYGGTTYSCRSYTEQWIREAILKRTAVDPSYRFAYASVDSGSVVPHDQKEWFAVVQYFSNHIWTSISEVVVAARLAMDWLQGCAKVAADEGLPITWTTPVGLPIMQAYPNMNSRRVKTKLGDSVIYLSLRSEEATIDKKRMKSSVSPNFVHSMDAAHLMQSVSVGLNNGITDFAMIHDSFGTHAADTELFGACLRHAFVDMYEGNDVLEQFEASIKAMVPADRATAMPTRPAKGDLDLQEVKTSDFFFA